MHAALHRTAQSCRLQYLSLPRVSNTRKSITAGSVVKRGVNSMASTELPERARAVLEYWFGPEFATSEESFVPKDKMRLWFQGGPDVDQYITEHFGNDVRLVGEGKYDSWSHNGNPLSTLAGIVLMDQFTRNIHRGQPAAFQLDSQALAWADRAVAEGADQRLPPMLRYFVYMPYMHAEDLAVQERGVQLFRTATETTAAAGPACAAAASCLRMALSYAEAHRDVIASWGRFPHRNAILGRESTAAEVAGLADGSIKKF
ncbi:hypothetical protein Agub_g14413 [Astrephomene gubernaculifera]|uniref:Uncharacterized protein n=1 Tax=Astrephomene gubernaculifera TaxID=47775 RepID=A0AAD3E3N6_9CHLO|nr:hypothetical protein Agub_g14413 [Astrephomene gubernaculifera]